MQKITANMLVYSIVIFAVSLLTAQVAYAQNSRYSVVGYEVENSLKNPAKARNKAISKATKLAFIQLLQNITPRQFWHRHKEIAANADYDTILQKFSIIKEETEPNYKLTLDLSYSPEAVRNLLTEMNIPYSEAKGGDILLIPLFELPSRTMLWEADNPWKLALSKQFADFNVFNFILPLGDMDEIRMLTPAMASLGAGDIIRKIAGSYNTSKVVVAKAKIATDFFGDRFIETEIIWYGDEPIPTTTTSVSFPDSIGLEVALSSAAKGLLASFIDNWQSERLIRVDRPGRVFLRFPPKGVNDLERLRTTVSNINSVKNIKLRVMNIKDSIFQVDFYGESSEIRKQLQKIGLNVSDSRVDMVWLVRWESDGSSQLQAIGNRGKERNEGGSFER